MPFSTQEGSPWSALASLDLMDMATFSSIRTQSKCDAMEAVRKSDVGSLSRYLEGGGDVNLSNPRTGRTLLHVACRQGCTEIVTLVLSHGARPAAKTLRHLSPLHLAAHEGYLKISRLLLEAWAPVDDRDCAGNTPLHMAARKGHADIVRLLLQCGANKNAVDKCGWAALHFAAWNGYARVARLLLRAGANTSVYDSLHKSTPLHLACLSGHSKVAKLLIEFAADSSAVDVYGALPDHVIGAGCVDGVHPSIAKELSNILVDHRKRMKDKTGSSSLECVVDSLRAKVYELEDQLSRAGRDHLTCNAYAKDSGRETFKAALNPECPVCHTNTKEAVLEPCRHLAACCSCARSLEHCPFCACGVRGYGGVESREAFACMSLLQEEATNLRSQLTRLSTRVRELATTNCCLEAEVRRAKADALVLADGQRRIDNCLLVAPQPPLPRQPPITALGDLKTDSDCGSMPNESVASPAARPFSFLDSTPSMQPNICGDMDAKDLSVSEPTTGRESSPNGYLSPYSADIEIPADVAERPDQHLRARVSPASRCNASRPLPSGSNSISENFGTTRGSAEAVGFDSNQSLPIAAGPRKGSTQACPSPAAALPHEIIAMTPRPDEKQGAEKADGGIIGRTPRALRARLAALTLKVSDLHRVT